MVFSIWSDLVQRRSRYCCGSIKGEFRVILGLLTVPQYVVGSLSLSSSCSRCSMGLGFKYLIAEFYLVDRGLITYGLWVRCEYVYGGWVRPNVPKLRAHRRNKTDVSLGESRGASSTGPRITVGSDRFKDPKGLGPCGPFRLRPCGLRPLDRCWDQLRVLGLGLDHAGVRLGAPGLMTNPGLGPSGQE